MRTIDWVDGAIELVDQTLLPHRLEQRRVTDLPDLISDIQRLAVRGAPALGVAGAMGVALIAANVAAGGTSADGSAAVALDRDEVVRQAHLLREARPTAVNLSWGVDRALTRLDEGAAAILEEALAIRDEDIAACISMGLRGADLTRELTGKDPVRVMTICNTGGLATVERGTALGVIQTLLEQGSLAEAFPLETRPLLQGARLTAWELQRMGAPFRLLIDSAGPFLLSRGIADAVFIGADRIAANGDSANKIGSFSLALAAQHAGVPFIVVAPESTVDMKTASGADIEIEDRGVDEVAGFGGTRTAPEGIGAVNPAFDVTPHELITAIVTERRIIRPGSGETLATVPLEPLRS
ncbi:S-methyl-5-thioribose-1-phosphate isomerase [Leucobacter luti]|uniref:Methylthioribose-1-phosphate isomerase n=1 Tax=Leucobacter luti TaxID=340320 RepID=A0A4R6S7G3_9MICO|nr:S-methyl-5-thioribose-1-phosphate isomerase [Leucobacter luti]MCW2288514.1 methylthioribose-1-phosphate isomerase [Leucobacter luti]QYM75549.1 S-methyl-5-thioribose-1-phosphate isomerase [Leucobacter luti]TCK45330.1 methylthioribose-1-phosphate isomerase [Leucobacter luti]TDP95859.1 methylthioribose-1-phosphate isomerase [Leucobacter luti]